MRSLIQQAVWSGCLAASQLLDVLRLGQFPFTGSETVALATLRHFMATLAGLSRVGKHKVQDQDQDQNQNQDVGSASASFAATCFKKLTHHMLNRGCVLYQQHFATILAQGNDNGIGNGNGNGTGFALEDITFLLQRTSDLEFGLAPHVPFSGKNTRRLIKVVSNSLYAALLGQPQPRAPDADRDADRGADQDADQDVGGPHQGKDQGPDNKREKEPEKIKTRAMFNADCLPLVQRSVGVVFQYWLPVAAATSVERARELGQVCERACRHVCLRVCMHACLHECVCVCVCVLGNVCNS
jgi:hypothetical protein